MSDRTPPGIEPGSDGRWWRRFISLVAIAPAIGVFAILGFIVYLAVSQ